jgi:hypothetical protein
LQFSKFYNAFFLVIKRTLQKSSKALFYLIPAQANWQLLSEREQGQTVS